MPSRARQAGKGHYAARPWDAASDIGGNCTAGSRVRSPGTPTTRWVRFEHATEGQGIFACVQKAQPLLGPAEQEELDRVLHWFWLNLSLPHGFDRSQRFWFRAESEVCIATARHMADLLRSAGVPIVERHVEGRGRLHGYADYDQVAAHPELGPADSRDPRRGRRVLPG